MARGRKKKVKSINKKVKNATVQVYDSIKFRSKLEVYMYKLLKDNGFIFEYEKLKITVIDAFEYLEKKVRPCTYLADFKVVINNNTFLVETKGRPNDAWPIKLKLIKKYLVTNNLNWPLFIPRNQIQCREVLNELLAIQATV